LIVSTACMNSTCSAVRNDVKYCCMSSPRSMRT
jgi:hypothetical protein